MTPRIPGLYPGEVGENRFLTPFNGRISLVAARSLKSSERCVSTVGSTPYPSAKLIMMLFAYIFEVYSNMAICTWDKLSAARQCFFVAPTDGNSAHIHTLFV
jgi:hypothetical protein